MNRKLKELITSFMLVCMMAVLSPWGHMVSLASGGEDFIFRPFRYGRQ